jgi:hypothetical protein
LLRAGMVASREWTVACWASMAGFPPMAGCNLASMAASKASRADCNSVSMVGSKAGCNLASKAGCSLEWKAGSKAGCSLEWMVG